MVNRDKFQAHQVSPDFIFRPRLIAPVKVSNATNLLGSLYYSQLRRRPVSIILEFEVTRIRHQMPGIERGMFYELYERAGKKYQFIRPKEANAGCCILLVYPQGPAVSDPSFHRAYRPNRYPWRNSMEAIPYVWEEDNISQIFVCCDWICMFIMSFHDTVLTIDKDREYFEF